MTGNQNCGYKSVLKEDGWNWIEDDNLFFLFILFFFYQKFLCG